MTLEALDFMKAMALVLCDKEKESDAILLHSRDDAESEMAQLVASAYNRGRAPLVVVNGTTRKQWNGILGGDFFGGYEMWEERLRERRVPRHVILSTPFACTTTMEAHWFVTMAQENRWKRITISALPYQMLRCFLTVIRVMQLVDANDLDVYNLTLPSLDWRVCAPEFMMRGEVERRDRVGHLTGEYERIINLWRRGEIATLEEMFAYLERRDRKI